MSVLEVREVTVEFGGLKALDGVSLSVSEGEIRAIIGPNGAGKTTLFNVITGFIKPSSGKILFLGKDITGEKPSKISRLGIARTFQNIKLFEHLTVLDNVLVGFHSKLKKHLFHPLIPHVHAREEERLREAGRKILEMVGLSGLESEKAGSLPYGKQRMLEIARALATGPKLLLLDEPAAGMNPKESFELMETIKKIRDDLSLTVVLIEHDMRVVMGISDVVSVLDYGELIAEGPPEEVRRDRKVIEAYLGEELVSFH